ncbi:MAG: dimethyl sulfoxide reductase anchor subunit [Alphaproteobacteria bacterium]|nr:dimethyl sulfoxide reductase anchor subunit [Alphaproteobacteria bacterium]
MTDQTPEIKGVSPWLQTNWDIRAAGNFIGGGTGTGFLVAAVFLGFLSPRLAAFVGLTFVGLGLFSVWLEIGRPWRSINLFFHPQTSWMTREGLVALPLFALGGLAVLFNSQAALIGAALVGLVYLYCQARILMAAKGIPAWRHPALLPVMMATGLTEGAGLAVVLAQGQGAFLLILLIALRFDLWRRYNRRLAQDGAPAGTLRALALRQKQILIAGHIAPVVLLVLASLLGAPFLATLGGVLATVAGWGIKVLLITKAAYNQGFALPRVPVRGQGSPGAPVKPGWA